MKVITDHPVAISSPDHLFPWGTARDNTTDHGFIEEIENFFNNKKIKTLDIGCSGGQLTIDFYNRGHVAIGIEGSDYSLVNERANWPQYKNKLLFTCNATKPYTITDDTNNPVQFDLITAWEVLEHIHKNDFKPFFNNILNHMHEKSIFCCSINTNEDVINGYKLHQSAYTQDVWLKEILPTYFDVYPFPFINRVRCGGSFHTLLKKKNIYTD